MACNHEHVNSFPGGHRCRECGMIGQWLLCGFVWYAPGNMPNGEQQLRLLELRKQRTGSDVQIS